MKGGVLLYYDMHEMVTAHFIKKVDLLGPGFSGQNSE